MPFGLLNSIRRVTTTIEFCSLYFKKVDYALNMINQSMTRQHSVKNGGMGLYFVSNHKMQSSNPTKDLKKKKEKKRYVFDFAMSTSVQAFGTY